MNKFYYPKLAASNIKKNGKIYFPYILTCIGTVMMFYIITALAQTKSLDDMLGGSTIGMILEMGMGVIGLFSLIFLFYSNSFLMKRRKKEFGLYNILGMEKKHISRIMMFESVYITLLSLVVGIGCGILFSKLVFLGLAKILHFPIGIQFEIPSQALGITVTLFLVIFTLTLLNSLRQIHLVNPIELLRGGQVGEKEPKAKWAVALLGLLCLGGGYAIALIVEDPLQALLWFFVAVVLVVLGTYLLFGAGSIALLKLLRKNKKFYYKTNHFISVSGMMYRMKQNAVGLANICILSTMVLVMVSGTVSLYAGMEDIQTTRYPRDIMIVSEDNESADLTSRKEMAASVLNKHGLKPENETSYRYLQFASLQDGMAFKTERSQEGILITEGNIVSLYFIPLEDYNHQTGKNLTLASENDALVFYNRTPYKGNTMQVLGLDLNVTVSDEEFRLTGFESAQMTSSYFVVVKDMELMHYLDKAQKDIYGENASDLSSCYGFDLNTDDEAQVEIFKELKNEMSKTEEKVYVESRSEANDSFYSLYGGLFFLGIFLGVLFIMAAVLIIYYKQISEGYEDKDRFEIMQKVGMSHGEVKKAIHSQVLTVFFLPLVTAGIHVCFALSVLIKLLAVLQLTNVTLFLLCTLGTFLVFALFYALIYSATAKVYYKIVSTKS